MKTPFFNRCQVGSCGGDGNKTLWDAVFAHLSAGQSTDYFAVSNTTLQIACLANSLLM